MALTDTAIRGAKPSVKRTLKLSDGGGLQLWVTPKGSKLRQVAYRFGGKQLKLSLGPYPAVGLKDAREQRDAAQPRRSSVGHTVPKPVTGGRNPSWRSHFGKSISP